MSDVSATNKLDVAAVRTVVDLADHLHRLRIEAEKFQQSFETGKRGFFSPSEDDQVLHLWISYHKSRCALLDLIDSIRRAVGKATEERAAEFAVAYAAGLAVVDEMTNVLRQTMADPVEKH